MFFFLEYADFNSINTYKLYSPVDVWPYCKIHIFFGMDIETGDLPQVCVDIY